MGVIDDYLEDLGDSQRAELERIRRIVLDRVPDAEEGRSYGMPAFRYKRKPLLGFAALLPRRYASNPVAQLERAVEAGEFVPYYQPIVDIRSGQLRGAEVLARWKKPDGSLVLPGAFIPLAETSGLILPLTSTKPSWSSLRASCRART